MIKPKVIITVVLAALVLKFSLPLIFDRETFIRDVYQGPDDSAAPTPAPTAIGRLSCFRGSGGFQGGTCFALEGKGKKFLVTAYHLFHLSWTWRSHQKLLNEVRIVYMFQDKTVLAQSSEPLRVVQPTYPEPGRNTGDVALFGLDNSYVGPALKLADKSPVLREPVWLYCFAPGSDSSPRLLKGHVVKASNKTLAFTLSEGTDLTGSSGSPLLNSAGEVVGIFSMFRVSGDRPMEGWAAPLSSIKKSLEMNE